MADDRHGAGDQEAPKIALAHLRYPAEPRLAAGRVLERHEAEPGRKVAPAPEALHRRGEGLDSHRGDRTDPRGRHVPDRLLVLARASAELPFQGADLRVKTVDLLEQNAAQLASRPGSPEPGSSSAKASRLT